MDYKNTEKYKQMKELNDKLTEATGVKHYPTIGEALEAKFIEKGYLPNSKPHLPTLEDAEKK